LKSGGEGKKTQQSPLSKKTLTAATEKNPPKRGLKTKLGLIEKNQPFRKRREGKKPRENVRQVKI